MSNRQRVGYWVSAWWPVVLGIIVIATESTEWLGADHTDGPLRTIFQHLFGAMDDSRWEIIHHYIRKSGHFMGYGLIGLAWLRAWWRTLPHSRFVLDTVLAMAGTALIASMDEFHQSFLPNRTSSPWDVLLDCAGALTLQFFVYVSLRTLKPKKLQRA